MSLTDFANINIVSETSQALQAGFGVPLILSSTVPGTWGSERIRFFAKASEVSADGFDTGGPEYLMASRLFSQEQRPPRIAIGRLANRPTVTYRLTPTAANNTLYRVRVGDEDAEYTSDGSATVAEISTGIHAAVVALDDGRVTATNNTTSVDLAASDVDLWFPVENYDPSKISVTQIHADPGVAADLDAIRLVDSSWYAILCPYGSRAIVEAISNWAEANEVTYIAQTIDTPVEQVAYIAASNSDIGTRLKDLGNVRTKLDYHRASDAFLDAGEAGLLLPTQPGSETWHAKQVAGVPVLGFTTTQLNNLKAKNVGWMYQVAGLNITSQGKTSGGEFYDVVRGRDWLKARMAERIFSRLANARKIAFTDDGIAVIVAEVRAQLQDGVEVGLLAAVPEPTVTFPKATDVSPSDKATRTLSGVEFSAVLAGAIHGITVNGVISLT